MITTDMQMGGKLAIITNTFLALIHSQLSLENVFGVIFAPLSFLMGIEWDQILAVGQLMGVKIVLNEFMTMAHLKEILSALNPHTLAVATIGIILGSMQALFKKEKSQFVARNAWLLLASGILVSSLTAL